MLRIRLMPCILAVGILALSAATASAQSGPAIDAAPPAGATDQGAAVAPTAPPGISVTPPTQFRPPARRESDGSPPVEGCPAGDNRKLELLV
jgi:hypothetical protein